MSNCNNVCHGTCASFDCSKGYGWITPNDNSVSIFVHWKDIITNSHFKSLAPGQNVQYQPIFGQNGKRKAINVSVTSVPVPVPQHNNHSIASHNFTMQYNNNNNTNTNINNNINNNYNHNQYTSYSQKPIQSTYQQPQYNNNYNNNNNMNTMNNMNNMLSQNYNNNNNNATSINTTTNSIRLPPNNIPNKSNNNAANALTQTTNVNHTNNECKDRNDFNVETKFKWQWLDDCNTWQDFAKDINERILSANADTIFYKIGEFSYKFEINRYDVSEGKQTNETTNTRRHCRKTEKKFAVHQGLTLKTMLDSSRNDKYPSWWFDKDTKLHVAKLVDWPLNNEICIQIIEMFDDSCNQFTVSHDIEAIYSVQNKYLWKNYQFQRELHSEALGKNKLNERYLFHGTEYEATQKITVQGFLRDHGKVMAYGRGTYFAADAAMSIDYSAVDDNDYQWMFLCAVILGESICGRKSYNVPPTKVNSCVHYESMVDDLNNPKIFVISKDYMAYPLFLIKFKQQHSIFAPSLSLSNIINGNHKKQRNKTNKSLIPIKTKGATNHTMNMKKPMSLPNIPNILNQISRKSGGVLSGLLKPTVPTPISVVLQNLISANNALVYQPTLPPPLYISNPPPPSRTFSIMNTNKSLHHTPAMPSIINNNLSVPAQNNQSLQYTLTMPATMNKNLSVSSTQNKQSTMSNNKSLHYPPTINNNFSVAAQNKHFAMGLPAFPGLPTSDPMVNNVKVTPVPTPLSLSPIVEQSQTNSFVPYSLTPYPSYLHSQPIVGSPMPPMPPLNLLQL